MKTFGLVLMGIGVFILLFSNALGNSASSAYTGQSLGSAFMFVVSVVIIVIGFIVWLAGPNKDNDNNIRPLL
ncbi:MAG: hypothetical protein RJA78_865 [Actinomycetota bacterium]